MLVESTENAAAAAPAVSPAGEGPEDPATEAGDEAAEDGKPENEA
jgi:hypothetical protein